MRTHAQTNLFILAHTFFIRSSPIPASLQCASATGRRIIQIHTRWRVVSPAEGKRKRQEQHQTLSGKAVVAARRTLSKLPTSRRGRRRFSSFGLCWIIQMVGVPLMERKRFDSRSAPRSSWLATSTLLRLVFDSATFHLLELSRPNPHRGRVHLGPTTC